MSSLTSLPTEVFVAILRCVGAENLWRTLVVSKYWHSVAERICYEDFVLDILAKDRRYPVKLNVPCGLSKFSRILALHFLAHTIDARDLYCVRIGSTLWRFRNWIKNVSELLPNFENLTEFRLTVSITPLEYYIDSFYVPFDDWISIIFDSLKQVKSLRRLEVDLRGILPEPRFSRSHLCPKISQLIPQLDSLRLRLPLICREVLSVPSDEETKASATVSRLRKAIINTTHIDKDQSTTHIHTSYQCQTTELEPGKRLCESLLSTARDNLPRMPNLQHLRVIWLDVPRTDIFATDFFTIRKAKISGWDWDEHGETDDEEEGNNSPDDDLFEGDSTSSQNGEVLE